MPNVVNQSDAQIKATIVASFYMKLVECGLPLDAAKDITANYFKEAGTN